MNPQDYIQLYGGKAASLLAQYYAGNTDLLFPFSIIKAEDIAQGRSPVFSFRDRQIARGSAIGDERSLVGVIDTRRNVSSLNLNGEIDIAESEGWTQDYINSSRLGGEDNLDVRIRLLKEEFVDPLQAVIAQSMHPAVISYARWEGLRDYSGVSSIVVSPENLSAERGSVIEHPNIKDHYLINIVMPVSRDFSHIYQFLADSDGNIIVSSSPGILSQGILSEEIFKPIVRMKQRTREAGFIPPTDSSMVELGFLNQSQVFESANYEYQITPANPVIFYQERQFLPFDYDPGIDPAQYEFNKFGRVPDGGLEVRVVKLGKVSDARVYTDGVPSAYVFDRNAINGLLPLSFQPNNMEVLIVPHGISTRGNSLEHNTARWVKKARLSLLFHEVGGRIFYDRFQDGEMLKLA